MNNWKNDVSVLLIFFVRDDVLEQTFEAIRQARPRRLLLWQDGPRANNSNDIAGIERCRKIVENIDWDCEVYKKYNEVNYGCDPSTFLSHKWAFSIVDKCIVLEDDCVPTQSFFPYCKELLDKYENDFRINRICGMNNLGELDGCNDDYFFTRSGSVWGWATWKRVADEWEPNYDFIKDEYSIKQLAQNKNDKGFKEFYENVKRHSLTGKPYWESVQSMRKLLSASLDIVPQKNMIRNVGVSQNSTHSVADINLVPKKLRKAFYEMDIHEIPFPLKHPKYIVENLDYPNYLEEATRSTIFTKIELAYRHFMYSFIPHLFSK